MNTDPTAIRIRPAEPDDIPELCALLNEIIRAGGTTAIEGPLSDQAFGDYYLGGPGHLCCFMAENGDGSTLGFQALEHRAKLPGDCADIATYARIKPKIPGVGRALFAATVAHAKRLGLAEINATIRADNSGGLAYYAKMGFRDHSVANGVPLRDGRQVDRISKRFSIE